MGEACPKWEELPDEEQHLLGVIADNFGSG